MTYRVILKANGFYYPQYKKYLVWWYFKEDYYDRQHKVAFSTERTATGYIEQYCKKERLTSAAERAAKAYLPKYISCDGNK